MERYVRKRDGSIVEYDRQRIENAIGKAAEACEVIIPVEDISKEIEITLHRSFFKKGSIPSVEEIQDIVERTLMEKGYVQVAKAYIIYRQKRSEARDLKSTLQEAENLIENYLSKWDWRVQENSNMNYSLQGMNFYISSSITARYWLNRIYPESIKNAHDDGDLHIHDLGLLAPYCVGWNLEDLLRKGFGGVSGKITSTPPKHLRSALGQVVNFFYTLQGECYSEDTEVLTERGWKYFFEVEEEDKVFTLNTKTGEIELQKPVRFYRFNFNGEIYNFKSRKIDLLVTPNHNMLVDEYKNGLYHRKIVKAKDFKPNEHLIPKNGIWKGKEEKWFFLPEIPLYRKFNQKTYSKAFSLCEPMGKYGIEKTETKNILMDDWLAFFGLYLTYGSNNVKDKRVKIKIPKKDIKKTSAFECILNKLPFKYIKNEKCGKIEFEILSDQLFSYLRRFGNDDSKFIPKEIKELSKRELKILFDWMIKGDYYYTKSKNLADDIQEIALKLGFSANIYEKYTGKFKWYRIVFSRSSHLKFKKESIRKLEYKGNVYCLEVPNHTLYVRRNGKACWCGNSAGAQAFSNFDTLLSPFIRTDKLERHQVKQALQEFLFNCNVPTRVGFQTPFENITLDLKVPDYLKNRNVIIGGKEIPEKYGDFQKEMDIFNDLLGELYLEGDGVGRIFTFPIPTINITKDFDWDNEAYINIWKMTGKYGIPYFGNYVNSDMKPEDITSMCCRLSINKKELRRRSGSLFGAGVQTGSIGVVTINMPRIAYLSHNEKEFFERLEHLMILAKVSLEIKRKVVEDLTEKELYPYSKIYLENVKESTGKYWANHFSTIGIVGMNEACMNFLGLPISSREGKEWTIKVLKWMREKILEFQEETGNLYNLEATPAEGVSYRFARKDREKFSSIYTQGTRDAPYYTNSVHLPVYEEHDIFELLEIQDDLQVLFTGGTVVHIFIGEEIEDWRMVKTLVKKIVERFRLPYFSITPTFSICPVHGYLKGKQEFCPFEHSKEDIKKYGIKMEVLASELDNLPKNSYILEDEDIKIILKRGEDGKG
uniref:Ribonucleoside triphosphate reductase n=1 Tax=candidate division WOR-3 bacterium TaxID=2052148 RepID=A0A7C4U888_UNCW3